jgi:hypothetical protein
LATRHPKRHSPPGDDEASIAEQILTGLIDNIKGKVTDGLYGWILNAIGLGGGSDPVIQKLDEIETTLNDIEKKIDALKTELEEVEKEIILAVEWNTQTTAIVDSVTRIDSRFSALFALQPDDKESAATLQTDILDENSGVTPDLAIINGFVQDGENGANPGQAGLLNMFINANIQEAMVNFQRGNVGPNTPLAVAAKNITDYFVFLIGVQLKGAVLLVNAYTGESETDQSQAALSTYQSNIAEQAAIYRAGMELLTVTYCYDQTLLGLFSGPQWDTSPLLLADATFCSVIAKDELVLRIWGGQGLGAFPFDTGTFISDGQSGPTLSLTGGSSPIGSVTPTGDYTLFPASNSSQWSMYRFRFPQPGTGTFQISPGVPDMPFFDCWVNPKGRFGKYVSTNPSLQVPSGTTAASLAVNFTGR